MGKKGRSAVSLDKPEAFAFIKPLYNSIGHGNILLSKVFSTSHAGGCRNKTRIVSLRKKLPCQLMPRLNDY
jgi:hypothetical protein